MSNIDQMFYRRTFKDELATTEEISKISSEKDLQKLKYTLVQPLSRTKHLLTDSEAALVRTKKLISTKLSELEHKISKVAEKVRGAVLAERGTSGAIYTTQIPINKQQTTEDTTTKIEGGIAFGVPQDSEEYANDLTLFKLKDMQLKSLTRFSINKESNDLLEDFIIHPYAQTNDPIEFHITLSGQIRTNSYVVLDPTDHILTEVYINGRLYDTKKLKRTVIIPVDNTTNSVGLRIYPTIHRTQGVLFKKIGFTELIYNEATLLVTKNITINKDLYQLVIDTCDNGADPNINIQYYVSINDKEWEACAPVAKPTALEQQSIITVDKDRTLKLYEVKGEKVAEGDYRFTIPNQIQTNTTMKHKVYLRNFNNISDRELTIICMEDIELVKEAIITDTVQDTLYIDGRLQEKSEIFLTKGVHKIFTKRGESVGTLNVQYLNTLLGEENIYLNVVEKEILLNTETGLKYVSFTKPELIDSLKGGGMFAYFPGVKSKKLVSTLKLKAVLQSIDKKTVPYVSRILVRGG